ncbi:MAG TPA: winged helix-turn-helix domain-containing protein [Dokdonella sp.]|uniref:winged helix-turn-helix domain-containing protein n=1 Tax=Dokdonella sp. TaxID=2291710 RepID=UPI002C611FCD|nr:winged helix-turn-helix domain-containing protein [Dokdonella sp.]HUD42901.1 winged helix-turn-helix domain-containing protein [Dokdonella sp.]
MAGRIYEFDGFRLSTATRQLWRPDGGVSVLPARVFDCVLHLIEQRARAVGRDELIAAVWNQTEVGDNVLAQLLARTRKLLDDGGDEQRVIRTIPGFGYHWVAATRIVEPQPDRMPEPAAAIEAAAPPAEPVAPEPKPTPARRHHGWMLALALSAILIAIVVAAALRHRHEAEPAVPTVAGTPASVPVAQRPALVLPAIVEHAEGQAWLRLGVMALVAERLDGAGRATIPSDNSVALSRGRDLAHLDAAALAELADTAGANWIVQPRVTAVGSRWRVELGIVHGQAPIRLGVSAEHEQVLDAAREAADRLLAGAGAGVFVPGGESDPALTVVLKQAQATYLDGKPEKARVLLDEAQRDHPESTALAYELGRMEYATGRLDAAGQRFQALIERLQGPDEVVMRARVLNALAQVHYQRRAFAEVERCARQTIELLQRRAYGGNELGRAWRELGTLASSEGRFEQSLAEYARARVLLAASGDWLGVTRTDAQVGVVLRRTGRLAESTAVLSRAADRLQAFHEAWHEGVIRSHLAAAWTLMAEPQAALTQVPRMRELDARIEHPGMRASMQLALADVLLDNGRIAEAAGLIAGPYRQIVDSGDRLNVYFAHALAARAAAASGEDERAEREATLAIEHLFDPDEDPRHVALTHLLRVRLQAARDVAAAERSAAALGAFVDTAPIRPVAAYARLAEALVAVARGDAGAARTAFESAQATPDLVPWDRLRIAERYVPWLIEQGDADRAAEIVGLLGDVTYRNYDAAVLEVRLYLATHQRAAWQAALDRADALAGERRIDPALRKFPEPR